MSKPIIVAVDENQLSSFKHTVDSLDNKLCMIKVGSVSFNAIGHEALTYVEADLRYSDPRTSHDDKSSLKEKLDVIKALYPQKLSEAEPSKVN